MKAESLDARHFSHPLSAGLQRPFAKIEYLFVSKTPTCQKTVLAMLSAKHTLLY